MNYALGKKWCIGISGKKKSGKDTIGDFLMRNISEILHKDIKVAKINMADGLKQTLSSIFDIPIDNFYDDAKKTQGLGLKLNGEELTPRTLMQQFGTEICRGIKDDCWVQMFVKQFHSCNADVVLCCDVRFGLEVMAIESLGGEIIRLTRSVDKDEHSSETQLDNWDFGDYLIDNQNMSLPATKVMAAQLFKKIVEQQVK